jgi:thioredoxin-like negative regulator of GroEL
MAAKEECMMELIKSAEKFNELISGDQPVVVKFFTDWCPDCRRMDMFIDEITAEYNQYGWYEINKDEVPDIAAKYDVMGIPSLLVFKNGEKLAHLHSANAKSPEQVQEFLQTI